MPSPNLDVIVSRKILAVEGLDEKSFLDALLKDMGITDRQIEDVGGKVNFRNRFPALLKRPGFFAPDSSPLVTHLAIVRDRDQDDAFKSIVEIVKKEGLVPPARHGEFSNAVPKIGIFIMPGAKTKGNMLEDLCLESVQKKPAMRCVDEFASCVAKLGDKPKNISKTKALAFMAAQPDIVNSVGLAAQKGYWDFGSPTLEELSQFLDNLR